MEEQDIQLLDQYFNDLLSAQERQAVENRAAADPDFAAEFNLRQRMAGWPAREARRKTVAENLATIGPEFFDTAAAGTPPALKATTVNWRRMLLAAASIALVAAAVWFFGRPEPSLYSRFSEHPPLALIERGSADQAATAAETAFNAGRYAEALQALDSLLAEQPANSTALLYRGICLLELQRPVEARHALEPLAQGSSALTADAVWYMALSSLQEKNIDACRQTLARLTPGDEHYQQAQALLDALK